MVSALTPASASSMASLIWSVPVGCKVPFRNLYGRVSSLTVVFVIIFVSLCPDAVGQKKLPGIVLKEGRLVYAQDSLGNRIPDFSYAGYKGSNETIPLVPATVVVSWKQGDQTGRIQKAIDYVSTLPLSASGFRGTVLLEKGIFEIAGGLQINASGVVLRGSGTGDEGTRLLGTGQDRETLLRVYGKQNIILVDETRVKNDYVPVGAMKLNVFDGSIFQVGDEIQITRPGTQPWIDELKMNDFGGETGYIGWKPGERDIHWNRMITAITGDEITIDAPITTALDQQYGGGLVSKVNWPGRIENVGVENLTLQSAFDASNPKDEQHRWMAITMESIRDAWVRQVNFRHFAGSGVAIWNTASRITVEDCKSLDPVSEIGGQRRYTFYTEGQQCLFQRLYTEYGYHDFGVGFMAAGPNAFVECQSYLPHSFSGTIDSWASGVLFDIVNVDGQAIRFGNRGMEAQGAGWTAANSMLWQCTAALVDCPAPPASMNWAYGIWAQFSGNGDWHETNGFVKPRSLFYGQLADRLGDQAMKRAQLLPLSTEATSSPTVAQAKEYVAESKKPKPVLTDWIDQAGTRNPISPDAGKAKNVDKLKVEKSLPKTSGVRALVLQNGKLTFGDRLATGNRQTVQWWRGNVRGYDAHKASPHVTRYVPGRIGTGLTDDLKEAIATLKAGNVTVLDHNYGLWYDRRRDDHQRIRRLDGEVWAPFYELPFARSGKGTAWDGLSKYDLTKYNHWYWSRLATFADLAEKEGVVLYHQNYFQHNILEAGGHYADFPWRTANNVNETPFPEPVNYAGDKRIFMAEQFYDVSDPAYRALHEAYIRKCLDNFADNTNVIQFISAEYTGPLSFVAFWLDVIGKWEAETGKDALIALSATKDVQDVILSDPRRSQLIDVIDIRYWWYGESKVGSTALYAPEGGKNLAPRQHARLAETPKETFESTYEAVLEYKMKYPGKAIIYNTHGSATLGWAIFMAGGSLMNLPEIADCHFLEDATHMQVSASEDGVCRLIDKGTGEQIIYQKSEGSVPIDLTNVKGSFRLVWVNPETGMTDVADSTFDGGEKYLMEDSGSQVLWLDKQ